MSFYIMHDHKNEVHEAKNTEEEQILRDHGVASQFFETEREAWVVLKYRAQASIDSLPELERNLQGEKSRYQDKIDELDKEKAST